MRTSYFHKDGASEIERPSAPLLDRALFLAEPEITAAQISPDGKLLAFREALHGIENIWIKRSDEPLSAARPVTDGRDHPPEAFYWSYDSRYLLFTVDSSAKGKADLSAVRVDEFLGFGSTPKPRNLTDGLGTPAVVLAVPEAAPDMVYVALNDGQGPQQDLYAIDIGTAKRTLLRRNDLGAVGWVFDLAGKPRLAIRTGKIRPVRTRAVGRGGPQVDLQLLVVRDLQRPAVRPRRLACLFGIEPR